MYTVVLTHINTDCRVLVGGCLAHTLPYIVTVRTEVVVRCVNTHKHTALQRVWQGWYGRVSSVHILLSFGQMSVRNVLSQQTNRLCAIPQPTVVCPTDKRTLVWVFSVVPSTTIYSQGYDCLCAKTYLPTYGCSWQVLTCHYHTYGRIAIEGTEMALQSFLLVSVMVRQHLIQKIR